MSARLRTLCLTCGPNVAIDEDGCCAMCGATATGPWLDKVALVAGEEQPVRDQAVRELAEEIATASTAHPDSGSPAWTSFSPEARKRRRRAEAEKWETRIRAFLAEWETSVAHLARESVLSVVRAVRDERCGVLSPGAREILERMGS